MRFEGMCPFVRCTETGPHEHPACPACKAVAMGNLFCSTCRATWPDTEFKRRVDAALGPGITAWPLGAGESKP